MKKLIIKEWLKIFIVIFFIAVVFKYSQNIDLYSIPWILLFLYFGYKIYIKFSLDTNFIAIVFASQFFLGLILLFIIGSFTERSFPFKDNYFGVYKFIERGTDDNGNTVGEREYLELNKIKKIDEKYYDELNYGESYGTELFIFWQTGIAKGYEGNNIKYYNNDTAALNLLSNFFTIGIISFFETILLAIKYFLVGILAFIFCNIFYRLYEKDKLKTFLIPFTIDIRKEKELGTLKNKNQL